MSKDHPPRGFTFVELLIVITLLGLLVALLLPAVSAGIEAARRNKCASNLGQLITAIHNYEMAHGMYPPGSLESRGPILNWPKGYHHSWLVQLLPYMEHASTQRHVDFVEGVYHPANSPVRSLTLKLLHCPSDSELAGRSNYAAVHHDREAAIDRDNNGVFFLNSRVRQQDVTDGLSHTLFLGEKGLDASDLGWMSGTRATLRNTGWATGPGGGGLPVFDLNEQGLPMLTPAVEQKWTGDGRDVEINLDDGNQAGGDQASGGQSERNSRARRTNAAILYVGGFSGSHPGGSQYAMGDGSVRFLSQNIDPPTYQRMGNRHDGRLLDEERY